MKFRDPRSCQSCGAPLLFETNGKQRYPFMQCSQCRAGALLVDHERLSRRVLRCADIDLAEGDNSHAILHGAMAVEWELGSLYRRWKKLDCELAGSESPATEKLDEEFRALGKVEEKLDSISELLTGSDFDGFQQTNATVQPKLSRKSRSEKLFRKRNQILHSGETEFNKSDAEEALTVAKTLIQVMGAMDRTRIRRLDKQLYPGQG